MTGMNKGPTPAMRQFYSMKIQHPGTILFFQMGDFYETFGEDAEIVSRELEITLTSRGRDAEGERMPLAGVPIHAAETYITRLVQKGYRVAICDQIEDPKTAKGVVKRAVSRIVTPGTIIDAGMLGSAISSYLMAIAPDDSSQRFGLAFLDISTGEFFVTEIESNNGYGELFSEVARYNPSECITPPDLTADIINILVSRGIVITPCSNEMFLEDFARRLLLDHFGIASLRGYGCEGMHAAISAAGACLRYAKETQKSALSHINRLKTRLSTQTMILDSITLRNLEIARNIRKGDEEDTLLSVLDETKTPMGRRLLRSFITAPLIARSDIEKRLDCVEFFVQHPLIRNGIRSVLHRFGDIERIAGRVAYGNAGPRDLKTLGESLERISAIKELLGNTQGSHPALIDQILDGLHECQNSRQLLKKALVDDPPVVMRGGGVIRDGYSAQLDELGHIARSGKNWLAEFQQKERERTGIKSLKVGYNKIFGYYIEVTKANLRSVPAEYQRKQTTTNGERFTIPVLQEKESLITNTEDRSTALELELYQELLTMLKDDVPILQETARNIGFLDVFSTLAEIAQKNRYTRPVLEDSERLIIRDGRHPVVEQRLEKGFVPNDTELDTRQDQILIITGANMAGKSTYMRTVALICILAQTGSFVPATHATVGIVDRIFTRVGAFDDLASGQSTFMVEMLELANILNNVTQKSLVILDEIGRGTSTLDGYSIARAVLEYLHGKGTAGPRTLFATHFHELVNAETYQKRAKNYHFAVRDTGKEVIFLRKLIPGATDRSYGIHVASLAGVPQKVTGRAEEILLEAMRRETTGAGRTLPRYTQMLLIDTPEMNMQIHPVIEKIKSLDLYTMTPLEALMILHELQKKAGEDT